MEVYAVLVQYYDFEDKDNNYAELRGIYKTKGKALARIYSDFMEEIEMDMLCDSFEYEEGKSAQYLIDNIESDLSKFGHISFSQVFGNGKCTIHLEKRNLI